MLRPELARIRNTRMSEHGVSAQTDLALIQSSLGLLGLGCRLMEGGRICVGLCQKLTSRENWWRGGSAGRGNSLSKGRVII